MKILKTGIWVGISMMALLLMGCSDLDKLYDQKVETIPGAITRTNTVFVTNVVQVAAITNAVTNVITGEMTQMIKPPETRFIVTPTITYDYAPATTITNLVPRSGVRSLIDMGGALPIPFAGTIALALGWLYSLYAMIRNKKVAAGIVMSVERGREFLQSTPEGKKLDAQFKGILAQHQDSAGIVAEVDKLLARYVDVDAKK